MTIGKTIAATPDFIQQKPNTIVQGAGMLGGLGQCINQIVAAHPTHWLICAQA